MTFFDMLEDWMLLQVRFLLPYPVTVQSCVHLTFLFLHQALLTSFLGEIIMEASRVFFLTHFADHSVFAVL